jgi:hypothetical protein
MALFRSEQSGKVRPWHSHLTLEERLGRVIAKPMRIRAAGKALPFVIGVHLQVGRLHVDTD